VAIVSAADPDDVAALIDECALERGLAMLEAVKASGKAPELAADWIARFQQALGAM
jgi:hypothetical protein